jgi:hypothetical protein
MFLLSQITKFFNQKINFRLPETPKNTSRPINSQVNSQINSHWQDSIYLMGIC